jgi:hypothetical protein
MVGVWPRCRPIEKRSEGVVVMPEMTVAQPLKWEAVRVDREQLCYRNLDINDWLGRKTRDGSRAVMVNANCERAEAAKKPQAFGLELVGPVGIVP